MVQHRTCREGGCGSRAVWPSDYCLRHVDDPTGLLERVSGALRETNELEGVEIPGVGLRNLELRDRRLSFCILSGAVLDCVDFSGCHLRYVYFDDATMSGTRFNGCDMQNCVFGGATMRGCELTDSEIVYCNFLGTRFTEVRLDDSDLYCSRFYGATFRQVSMRNCNLQETHFDRPPDGAGDPLERLGVDSSNSNTTEAVYGGER